MPGHFFTRTIHRHPGRVMAVTLLLPTILLIILLTSAGAGKTRETPQRVDLQRVEVMQISQQSSYLRSVNIVGRVEAGEQTSLGFERAGTVMKTLVDEGQSVVAGQLLAELDMQRLNAQLQEADAAVKRAKADARLAQLSERRINQLVSDNLESPQRLDEARESTLAALALLDEMQARRFSIEVEFEKSRLYAPFDGVLISRKTDSGSVVAPGQPIFSLIREGSLQVRMAMSSDDAFHFAVGQKHQVKKDAETFLAEVISIGGHRNIQTRTVDVMLALPADARSRILQGDVLSLQLQKRIQATGFWLPKSALTSSIRGLWSVFSVSQPGQEQVLQSRNVHILYSNNNKVFVRGSVVDNEYIVAAGVHRLVPQQLVLAVAYDQPLLAGKR